MARWLLISVFIGLAMVGPTIGGLDIASTIFEAAKSIDRLTYATFDLIKDVAKDLVGDSVQFAKDSAALAANELPDTTPKNRQKYDFVIVGAGSAGATLASRLSELGKERILLIEAGGHEQLLYDIPLLPIYMQFDKDIYWNHQAEPSDNYCLGMENHQCQFSIGKVMGGSSTVNFMIATRGNYHLDG